MSASPINASLLHDLRARLHGQIIVPGDSDYDSARTVWNGMIDKHPLMIVRCTAVADVVSSLQFARSQHLPIAIRGGGHSYAGNGTCDDGIVIDLSPMKHVQVDPARRIAYAQAGLQLGEYIRETESLGLITPVGIASDTGLSGLTLGGGLGFLMGKFGLTIDNLLAVEIVTADGQVLQASDGEHSDLFWAVRGGGGNFGVVTSFTFRLHPVDPLLAGLIAYPMDRAREVLHAYREFIRTVPDELTAYAVFARTPDGIPVIGMAFCYCGSLVEGERLIAPMRTIGAPLLEIIRPVTYGEFISMFDFATPHGRRYYSRARSLKRLDDGVLDLLVSYGLSRPSPLANITLQHVHGAVCRVDPAETAFWLREEHFALHIMAGWDEDTRDVAANNTRWARELWAALEPFAVDGAYINYIEDEGEDRVRASYGGHYERLARIKATYDPENAFHLNQNIKPAT